MAYCRKCGEQIFDEAVICPKCGVPQNKGYIQSASNDEGNNGLYVLSALIPLIGLVLYCVYINSKPVTAKGCGKWALIGFCVFFVIGILAGI